MDYVTEAMRHYDAAKEQFAANGVSPAADFHLRAAHTAALMADTVQREEFREWVLEAVANLRAQGVLPQIPPLPGETTVNDDV